MTNTQISEPAFESISADSACAPDAIYARLTRLLEAPAPANSCALPGAVGDVISALASELGLACAPFGSSGNLVIEIGDPAAPLDLLVTAHMDRPCFRVRNLLQATLYPLCAIRVPGDSYTCEGRALRFVDGRVSVTATGRLRFDTMARRLPHSLPGGRWRARRGRHGDDALRADVKRGPDQRRGPGQRHRRAAGAALGTCSTILRSR